MESVLLVKNILDYFIDLDNISRKKDEMHDVTIDCIGLDLQFYFEERKVDTQKILKEIERYKNIPLISKITPYFEWLLNDFKKLVDESEINDNQWKLESSNLETKRVEIDLILTNKEIQLNNG
jgi:hypothetical protein